MNRPPRPSRLLGIPVLLAMLALVGCTAPDEVDVDPGPPQPLAHDPTDDWTVTPWWASETEVLHLRPNGSFELHPERNRHRAPVLVGRWSKNSYARMTLETYDALQPERLRVGVDRIDGRLVLRVPGRPVFVQVDVPPRTPEDEVIGVWTDDAVALTLRGDGGYELRRAAHGADAPAHLAGHVGTWALHDDAITLFPGATTIAPVTVTLHREGDVLALRCEGVDLHRPR